MSRVHIVLLSGGSGTRLWPLSTNTRPKQFLKVLRDTAGHHVSMVQRVFSQIRQVSEDLDITVATSVMHQEYLHAQLTGSYATVLEPERRDTAPAIMLACAHLALKQHAGADNTVVVMPIDTYADQKYYDQISALDAAVQKDIADLVLLGVKPTYPSEKYGYILPKSQTQKIWPVKEFKEKPTEASAREIISQGALWNCGVFAFRLSYLSSVTEQYYHPSSFEDLREHYSVLPKISFDYEVVEKAASVAVVPYEGAWKDLGTWNTLTDEMAEATSGRVTLDSTTCHNVHVVNETNIPLVVAGISDTAVVATPDGILVTSKKESAHIKGLVQKAQLSRPMYEKRPWGEYHVLSAHTEPDGREVLTQELIVTASKRPRQLAHDGFSEVWTVISGTGAVEVDGRERPLAAGDVIRIPASAHLVVRAVADLHIIEVRIPEGINPFLDVQSEWQRWQERATACFELLSQLKHNENELADSFCRNLSFGTGGIRAKMGAGPNRLNVYTVARATQGLSNWLHMVYPAAKENELTVAIARDTRHHSDSFARIAAEVFAANNIVVRIYREPTPTPTLSFAVRKLACAAGVVITASHNRAEYNGYKVYNADGCQITTKDAQAIQAQIDSVDMFDDVRHQDFEAEMAMGRISWIDSEVLDDYQKAVIAESLGDTHDARKDLSIIYTPLNGTGNPLVPAVLKQTDFIKIEMVPQQSRPDPSFATCPYPNPESSEALSCGLDIARRKHADILIATDPDCDRMGLAVNHDKSWQRLTGNDVGVLLLDWLCCHEKAAGHSLAQRVVITTIVTTPMIDELAKYYGFELRRTLTGFKFIGEQIGLLEAQGEQDRFLFGLEESIGYLKGTYVRDKDGVIASLLACEMAADYKAKGIDLIDRLDQLHDRFGHFATKQISVPFQGIDGPSQMRSILAHLRELNLKELANLPVLHITDYIHGAPMPTLNSASKRSQQKLPASNVLQWDLSGGSRLLIRPSGTEPKLKSYLFAHGATEEGAIITLNQLESGLHNLLK
jgi:phosphomannomutase/mannose-1-phosphate guanylyltransferase/mannose-6-phosphate isomerase-like protein (cupin superfamily)